jgi:hypothetical protein
VVTSLDGEDWQLRGCLGDEWQGHVNKPWDAPGWLPARVPGSVLDDLAPLLDLLPGESGEDYGVRIGHV